MSRPDPIHPEVRLIASAQPRHVGLTQSIPWPDAPDPELDELIAAVARVPQAWGWTISGGEPTTRADLPTLIRLLRDAGAHRLGLATDGLALTEARVVAHLRNEGLERIRIPLHCGRADAHDWIVGVPGAARRVRRAFEACTRAGLEVEAEVIITRSTTPWLSETVELLSALGARTVHFRRPRLDRGATRHSVSLSPRLGLLQPELESAVRLARRRGLSVSLHDFPHCAAPAADRFRARAGTEHWVVPTATPWAPVSEALKPLSTGSCGTCPADCPGAPADYVERFGWHEFRSEGAPPEPDDTWIPAARGGWMPATRVGVARTRSRGPQTAADSTQIDELDVWLDPSETTRTARARLVHASQERPKILRLAGWAMHPAAMKLLAETGLLFPTVHVYGDLDPLDALSDRQLKRLEGVARFEALLYGTEPESHDVKTGRPGSFDATVSVVSRLAKAGFDIQIHAVVSGSNGLGDFAARWKAAGRPGQPSCVGRERSDVVYGTWTDAHGPVLWEGEPGGAPIVCTPCACGRDAECAGVSIK